MYFLLPSPSCSLHSWVSRQSKNQNNGNTTKINPTNKTQACLQGFSYKFLVLPRYFEFILLLSMHSLYGSIKVLLILWAVRLLLFCNLSSCSSYHVACLHWTLLSIGIWCTSIQRVNSWKGKCFVLLVISFDQDLRLKLNQKGYLSMNLRGRK